MGHSSHLARGGHQVHRWATVPRVPFLPAWPQSPPPHWQQGLAAWHPRNLSRQKLRETCDGEEGLVGQGTGPGQGAMVWRGLLGVSAGRGGVMSALLPSLAALLPLAKDPELSVRTLAAEAIFILIREMPRSGWSLQSLCCWPPVSPEEVKSSSGKQLYFNKLFFFNKAGTTSPVPCCPSHGEHPERAEQTVSFLACAAACRTADRDPGCPCGKAPAAPLDHRTRRGGGGGEKL